MFPAPISHVRIWTRDPARTKTEIMRCLKRYIAREVFPHLLMTTPGAVFG